jgi:transposase
MGSFERALFPEAQGCALLRTRKQLVREQAGHVQRVQKTLEGANIKLPSVLSNVVGMSGRAIIEALIAGVTDPEKLTALAPGRIECSRDGLCAAVRGRMTPHHRFLLRLHLRPIDALQSAMDEIDREVDANLASFASRFNCRARSVPDVSGPVQSQYRTCSGSSVDHLPFSFLTSAPLRF